MELKDEVEEALANEPEAYLDLRGKIDQETIDRFREELTKARQGGRPIPIRLGYHEGQIKSVSIRDTEDLMIAEKKLALIHADEAGSIMSSPGFREEIAKLTDTALAFERDLMSDFPEAINTQGKTAERILQDIVESRPPNRAERRRRKKLRGKGFTR